VRGGETKGRKLLCKRDVGEIGGEKGERGGEMRRGGNEMEGGSERRCCGG